MQGGHLREPVVHGWQMLDFVFSCRVPETFPFRALGKKFYLTSSERKFYCIYTQSKQGEHVSEALLVPI